MTATLDRKVLLGGAANFRDLGGLVAEGGIVTPSQIFRSASLAKLSDDDMPKLETLKITTIFDLRTEAERVADPDRLPLSARLVGLDVLADGGGGVAQAIAQIRENPAVVNSLLSAGKVDRMLEQSYRDFIDLPSARASYRSLFQELASPERTGAALFHCTAGKDRTGWAAASLLLLLGVDDASVRQDYLQTNADFLPTLEPLFQSAAQKGVDLELLREAMSVKESYLDTALDRVETEFGSIEQYFLTALGLDESTISQLRERFIA